MGTRHWPEDADEEVERLEKRIRELETAIRQYLRENGYSYTYETLDWWVEHHQPCDVRTVTVKR